MPENNARGQGTTSENTRSIPELISPADGARVFGRVSAYLRTGEDPGATGVRVSVAGVTVRLRGERIGEGVVWEGNDAVGEAMRLARRQALTTGGADIPAWGIELELGGAWTPRGAATWDGLSASSKPALRGTAARLGVGEDATTAVLMPNQQLRFGMGPLGVWRRVSAQAGAPLGLLSDVVRDTGVRFWSFECARIVQRDGASPISFPHRTRGVSSLARVTTPALRERAALMSRFLVSNRWRGRRALGMTGDLRLHSGEHRPEVAPLRTQMGAAFALARFARTTGVDPESAASARDACEEILRDALTVEPGETLFVDDPVAAAGYMVALAELRRVAELPEDLVGSVERTRELVAGFGAGPGGSRIEADVAALVALALLRDHADLGGPERHRDVGATVARALIAELGAEGAHTAMPWLGWALIESSPGAARVAGDAALRASRDRAERLQANRLLLDTGDRDLVGGFLWGEDAQAYPDWRSAKTGAMLGMMMGEDRLTPASELPLRLDRVRRGARFLVQRGVDGSERG
ncbi:MAG: hypothetical protein AAGH64_09455, partial [Planctomycetota bacterium]